MVEDFLTDRQIEILARSEIRGKVTVETKLEDILTTRQRLEFLSCRPGVGEYQHQHEANLFHSSLVSLSCLSLRGVQSQLQLRIPISAHRTIAVTNDGGREMSHVVIVCAASCYCKVRYCVRCPRDKAEITGRYPLLHLHKHPLHTGHWSPLTPTLPQCQCPCYHGIIYQIL